MKGRAGVEHKVSEVSVRAPKGPLRGLPAPLCGVEN